MRFVVRIGNTLANGLPQNRNIFKTFAEDIKRVHMLEARKSRVSLFSFYFAYMVEETSAAPRKGSPTNPSFVLSLLVLGEMAL